MDCPKLAPQDEWLAARKQHLKKEKEFTWLSDKLSAGTRGLECSIFPREIVPAPRSWAERFFPNLIHWNELDRGGHFAAFEQPTLLTKEMRDCFRSLR